MVRWDRTALNDVTASKTGNYYSVSMHQITDVLDALNISWTPGNYNDSEPATKGQDETVEETEAPVVTEPQATEPPVAEKTGPNWIIIAIIALVVILIVVVVIIVIVVSKKNKGNGPKGGAPTPGPGPAPTPTPAPNRPASPSAPPYAQPYNRPQMPMGGAPTAPSNDGAGETSVLNDGAGETTVLGGGAGTGFTLLRKSNNEKININKPEFTIGKERRRVDYCIADNNSVSRVHAKLKVRGGTCYIADLGSTNCTYVNGTKLSPNQEVALKKGDKITVSDVDFELI